MERIFVDLFRIQFAFFEGWLSAMSQMWQGWQHVNASSLELLRHPSFHRWHNEVMSLGPDWADHYGKRAHDIDVEHMR